MMFKFFIDQLLGWLCPHEWPSFWLRDSHAPRLFYSSALYPWNSFDILHGCCGPIFKDVQSYMIKAESHSLAFLLFFSKQVTLHIPNPFPIPFPKQRPDRGISWLDCSYSILVWGSGTSSASWGACGWSESKKHVLIVGSMLGVTHWLPRTELWEEEMWPPRSCAQWTKVHF